MAYLDKEGNWDTNQFPYRFDPSAVLPVVKGAAKFITNPAGTMGDAALAVPKRLMKGYMDLPTTYQAKKAEDLKGYVPNPNYVSQPAAPIQDNRPNVLRINAALDNLAKKAMEAPDVLPAHFGPRNTPQSSQGSLTSSMSGSLERLMAANPGLKVNMNGQPVTGPSRVLPENQRTNQPVSNQSFSGGTGDLVRTVLPDGTISITNIGTPSRSGPARQPDFHTSVQEKLMDAMKELSRAQTFNGASPSPEGEKRVKAAMDAVTTLGTLSKNLAPNLQALSPGQTLESVSGGKSTRIADNLAPYERKQKESEKVASTKQTAANKKAMFNEASKRVQSSWKVFGKGWDEITKAYEGDPEGLAVALNKHQSSYFSGIGVPNEPLNGIDGPGLADIPQSFNLFIKMSGKQPKDAKELEAAKKKHSELLRWRKGFIDDFYRKIGYHTENAKYGSYEPTEDEE